MKTSIVLTLAAVAVVIAAFGFTIDKSVVLEKRMHLKIRNIGHRLLLYAGDSSSRVLPVRQLRKGVFEVEFQSPFSFMPDTLVKIVRSELSMEDKSADYIVNVFDCTTNDIVYGFELGPDYKETIPCLGRAQPRGCYTIQIAFADLEAQGSSGNRFSFYGLTFIGLTLVAFVGRLWFKKEKTQVSHETDNGVAIGRYLFSTDSRRLRIDQLAIELSDKESKLLSIFATRQNQIIDREELLKRVWEDDGVFTGRSLDVFISKLRKKLKDDPSVHLVNIHGKGYKLETKV